MYSYNTSSCHRGPLILIDIECEESYIDEQLLRAAKIGLHLELIE